MPMEAIETYLSAHRREDRGAPAWLHALRRAGIEHFERLGFPKPRLEEWKYTDVAPIARTPFRPAAHSEWQSARQVAREFSLPAGCELVFLNGRLVPSLSAAGALPPGVVAAALAEARGRQEELLREHLGRYAAVGERHFVALNTAFLGDGALLYIPRGAVVAEPIHLLFLGFAPDEPVACFPRVLIVAEEGSRAVVVETYAGRPGERYFTDAVTEIALAPGAQLAHVKVQLEGEDAFHVGAIEIRQAQGSRFESHSIALGAALSRTEIRSVLAGEGAECGLNGLYLVAGRQHVDHQTCMDHERPGGTSRQLYKGVLDGRATGVFHGRVIVRPGAQKSDAQQVNKNLLLSEEAAVNSQPQLEIFADDVRCSHGAAVGQIDEEALFYLRARGIDPAEARAILIAAFANEFVERIPVDAVRARLAERLRGALRPALVARVGENG